MIMSMVCRRPVFWALAVLLISNLFFASRALAVPAFARKYNVPCTLCHTPFPKLNDFGNAFRDNGYQMGSDADDPVNQEKAYWPIALRTTVGYQGATKTHMTNSDGNLKTATMGGFGFTGLDILSLGTLTKDISVNVVFTPGLGSAGFGTDPEGNAVGGDLEAAWVRFDNIFGSSLLNVKVGKFEMDLPFSEHRTLTLNSAYVVYHYMPGAPFEEGPIPNNATLYAYSPKEGFELGENQVGVELMGHKANGLGNLRYTLDLLSNNNNENLPGHQFQGYGHVTQAFNAMSNTHRVGLFGLIGEAPTKDKFPGTVGTAESNAPFYRLGGDVDLRFGQFELLGVYMHAGDSERLFTPTTGTPAKASWNGGFAEFNYMPKDDIILVYRFDIVRNSNQGDNGAPASFNNTDSHTALLRYMVLTSTRADLALHLEYNNTKTRKTAGDGSDQTAQTFLVGWDFAY